MTAITALGLLQPANKLRPCDPFVKVLLLVFVTALFVIISYLHRYCAYKLSNIHNYLSSRKIDISALGETPLSLSQLQQGMG